MKYTQRNMDSNNILTNQYNILPIFKRLKKKPRNWQGLFNFKNIQHNLLVSSSYLLNGCSIKNKNNIYICYPLSYKAINKDKLSIFSDLDLNIIKSLELFKPVDFKDLESLIFYINLPLIIEYLTKNEQEFIQFYSSFSDDKPINSFYKPTVLEVNKNSIYLERKGNQALISKDVEEKLINVFLSLKIATLELPQDYDLNKTIEALEYFKSVMDKVKLPIRARNFNLKFKKLGTYKDDGFYSQELNTIVVDARKVDVFIHELGHLIFDNDIKISKTIKSNNSEDYAIKFTNFLTNYNLY